ncbi:hypothetical protein FEM08_15470 [Flavobacterium gilvum]|nr:hypothetical protein FEM08_15470 [Flavobacterium gilvum]
MLVKKKIKEEVVQLRMASFFVIDFDESKAVLLLWVMILQELC